MIPQPESDEPLIDEPLNIKEEYFQLSKQMVSILKTSNVLNKPKLVVAVCGESGSGKSVTAHCLQIELKREGINALVLHQDNYYKLPPADNHDKRKANIEWVGPQEVRLDFIEENIEQFRANKSTLILPKVHYQENIFSQHEVAIDKIDVLIIEGVYSFFVEGIDFKVFMERNFQDTLEARKNRTRETYDPFVEQVLKIEHELIVPLAKLADVKISKEYQLKEA